MGTGVNKVGSGVTERTRITLFSRMGNFMVLRLRVGRIVGLGFCLLCTNSLANINLTVPTTKSNALFFI
jgi:hypothetical protein